MSNQEQERALIRILPDNPIRELNVPKDVLEELQKILSSPKSSDDFKKFSIKRLMKASPCCICGGIPSCEVIYDVDGGSRIERYCQSCSERVFTRNVVI